MKLENKKKEFVSMLLGTLGANLLQNILAGKGVITKCVSEKTKSKRQRRGINRAGAGIVKAGYGNKKGKKTTKWISNAVSSFK